MTILDIIEKYGEDKQIALTFTILYLFATKFGIDFAEVDTILGLAQKYYGETYTLNFLETLTASELVIVFTDLFHIDPFTSVATSENIALFTNILPSTFTSVTTSEDLTFLVALFESVNDAVSITEAITTFSDWLSVYQPVEDIALTENISIIPTIFGNTVFDSATISENVVLNGVFNRNIFDPVNINETISVAQA